jgi:hypothetical protein
MTAIRHLGICYVPLCRTAAQIKVEFTSGDNIWVCDGHSDQPIPEEYGPIAKAYRDITTYQQDQDSPK